MKYIPSTGEYEYQYVVESGDTSNEKKKVNKKLKNITMRNQVGPKRTITVQKEDFDVFQALDMDDFAVSNSQKQRTSQHTLVKPSSINSNFLSSRTDKYGQNIPNYTKKTYLSTAPPIIPPHLLHYMLNKRLVGKFSSVNPELLPKPCHTLLNHLYAKAIKDDVMTLSTTRRYRQKYVTTIFYCPIPNSI